MSTATILLIAAVFLIGIGLGAMIILVALRRRQPQAAPKTASVEAYKPVVKTGPENPANPSPLVFRWSYALVPVILAGVCLVLALAFIFSIPDPLAFRFNSDGSALTSMSKYAFVILMAALQIFSALVAVAIAQTIVKVSKNMFKASEAPLSLDGFVSLMSNMVLLPQAILAYLMLDAFIYGTWSIHLISFTLFAILAVAVGSLILIFMFIRLSTSARTAINRQ